MIFGGKASTPGWVGVCISSWYMMSQCCWPPPKGWYLSRERTKLVEKMCLPPSVNFRNSVWTYFRHFWKAETTPVIMKIPTQPQSKQPIQKYTLSETNIAPGWNTFFVPFRVRRIFKGFGLLVSGMVNRQRLSEVMKPTATCQVWFSSQTAAIFGEQEGISSLSKCSMNFAVIHLSHDKKKSGWSIFGGFLHGFHPYTVKLCIGFLNF